MRLGICCLSALLVTAFILCENVAGKSPQSSDLRITIKRDACFGSCPVYSAIISGDGTVIYLGNEFVKVKGKRRYKISKGNVDQLIAEIQRANYFSLKDKYTEDENGMSVTDLPSTTTKIRLNGKTKEVYDYYRAPKELRELETKIDELAGLIRFIGKK